MKFGKTVTRLVSKLNMRGKKMKPEKAEFISENALFFRALTKEKKSYPKLSKTHQTH